MRFAACSLLAFSMMPSAGAQASPCDAATEAFKATAKEPAYRQTITVRQPPSTIEQVVVGQTLYMKDDNRWMKLNLKPDGRLGMLNAILKDSSMSKCSEKSSEKVNGVTAKVYHYTMSPPAGLPGAKAHEQTLFVDDKGRVIKLVAEEVTAIISYDNVTAPVK